MRTLIALFAVIGCSFALVKPDPLLDGLLCSICTDIVTEAENAGLDYSETWLNNKITEYCAELGFFKSACVSALDNVVKDLDTYIRQALAPNVCCQKVSMCK